MRINVNGQLKNQIITFKAEDKIYIESSIGKNLNEDNTRLGLHETKIASGLILAGTNILVNTVTRVLKNRISNKTIEYTISHSGENFYFIHNGSTVYQGIDCYRLTREEDKKLEFLLDIKPVFSKNNQFFKWKIDSLNLIKVGFKKRSTNTDIEIKISFKYYKQSSTPFSLESLPEQIITVYSAKGAMGDRVYESEWMQRPSFGNSPNLLSPAYTIVLSIKEMTSVPEIYKEVIKEEDAFKKSLTDYINKLANSSDKGQSN